MRLVAAIVVVLPWPTATSTQVGGQEDLPKPVVMKGEVGFLDTVAYSRDGRLLASSGMDFREVATHEPGYGVVSLWDTGTGRVLRMLRAPAVGDRFGALAFSTDGKLVVGCTFWRALLWDADKGQLRRTIDGPRDAGISVTITPAGDKIAWACKEGIRLWDVESGTQLRHLRELPSHSLAFSTNGRFLFSGAKENPETVFKISFRVEGESFESIDNTASHDATIWDVETGDIVSRLPDACERFSEVDWTPDGKSVAVATGRKINLWDSSTGQRQFCLERDGSSIEAIAFSPDGQLIASSSERERKRTKNSWRDEITGQITLWDLATRHERITFPVKNWDRTAVLVFSKDSEILTGAIELGEVRSWRIPR